MHYQIIIAVAAYFISAAAVGAMSAPTKEQESGFYGWLYRFLQILAANGARLAEAKFGAIADVEGAHASTVTSTTVERRVDAAISTTK